MIESSRPKLQRPALAFGWKSAFHKHPKAAQLAFERSLKGQAVGIYRHPGKKHAHAPWVVVTNEGHPHLNEALNKVQRDAPDVQDFRLIADLKPKTRHWLISGLRRWRLSSLIRRSKPAASKNVTS